jgi:hypothetical protein
LATSRDLLAVLEPYRPSAESDRLVFSTPPPVELRRLLSVLHTGVRAQLAERTWYGERSDWPGLTALDPAKPIPAGITLLCVAGDSRWDRIDPAARLSHPDLFAPATAGNRNNRR